MTPAKTDDNSKFLQHAHRTKQKKTYQWKVLQFFGAGVNFDLKKQFIGQMQNYF